MVEIQKTVDSWFGKIQKGLVGKIEHFVATLFFLIALGALFAIALVHYWPHLAFLAVLVPLAVGALAYVNRAFAIAVFVIFILFIFL
ncbi:Uncharacterised protein [uncultured archaeon]|nr:Uncharacterised protein [uncultured archaeon]